MVLSRRDSTIVSQARSAWNHEENSPFGFGARDQMSKVQRHFVAGYSQPVPLGQKPFAYRSASQLS
jgi:hypothetical protein